MTPIEKLRAAIQTIDLNDRETVFTLGTDSVDALKAALADSEPMTWTTTLPTASGFYWVFEPRLKRPPTLCELLCEYETWNATVIGTDQSCYPADFDPSSLWCGPINPPEVPT